MQNLNKITSLSPCEEAVNQVSGKGGLSDVFSTTYHNYTFRI